MTKKSEQIEKKPVTVEDVKRWSKHDLSSAIYFLSTLQRYPEIMDKVAEELYEHAKKVENPVLTPEQEN